ncbi:DNA breaking-rejoining protein [Salmonella enterica subsp. enterica]|nr:DNA breaking-rejoining protein [Salmonella enterica]ECC3607240.1 DNA breaking-rejoining protein [Salmonella enterica subsp. enterica]EGI6197729.1 DNA breaking-rejoining protein [Salmonella enterica subsp. enterica serovar Eastbourne]ECE0939542.1 DNA breaking-rejoining protein [Salmonella enterica subsp. enterica]ECH9416573.1 DNA breaking-rejoining protein [Salmonella enterica subsp. enterica]
MANPLERLNTRMDEVTAARFGRPALIDGSTYVAVESTFLAEFGPVSGEGKWLVVFDPEFKPDRQQQVIWDGQNFVITRWQRFNGKYQILLE